MLGIVGLGCLGAGGVAWTGGRFIWFWWWYWWRGVSLGFGGK
jgi:hypothetical protein